METDANRSSMSQTGSGKSVTGSLEVSLPDCVADDFEGEIVALNLATGVYYSLRDMAAAVWRDLVNGVSAEELTQRISNIDTQAGNAVAGLIGQLLEAGLMRPGNGAASEGSELESEAMVRAGKTDVSVDFYDDMKDLILADPIHEVDDQAGWPVMPQAIEKVPDRS